MTASVAGAGGLAEPPARASTRRPVLAALLAADALLVLVAATTGPSGLSPSWAVDVAWGLTALSGAGTLLERPALSTRLGVWGAALGVASVMAHLQLREPFDAALRVPGVLAMALLAFTRRRDLSSALGALCLVVQATALAVDALSLTTGVNPLEETRLAFDGRLGSWVAGELRGEALPYRLPLPTGVWFDFIPSPDAPQLAHDRWVVQPEHDAYLQVRAEALAGASHLDLDSLVTRAERHHPRAEIVSTEVLVTPLDGARLVHLAELRGLHPHELWIGVFVRGDAAFEVTGSAPKVGDASMLAALRQAITAFTYEPPIDPALSEAALDATKEATVLVRAAHAAGSGVVVAATDDATFVLTNAHVVALEGGEADAPISVSTFDESVHRATLARVDVGRDLALLRCDPLAIAPSPLRASASLSSGALAFAVGFPFGTHLLRGGLHPQPTVTAGRLLAFQPDGSRALSVGVNPGNSGGPVVASDGSVLGLAQAMVPESEISAMVPSEQIRPFLDPALPVVWTEEPLPAASRGAPDVRRDLAEAALVQVWSADLVGPGVVVARTPSSALIVTRSEWLMPGTPPTVAFDEANACAAPQPAHVVRGDRPSGLALLSVDTAEAPSALPLAPIADLPETTPVAALGWRVRTSPFVPREPVTRLWRGGSLSSKQLDPEDNLRLALVDVGINPDFRGGPVIDTAGDLLGFVVRDGDPTNLTRVAPAERIEELLAGEGLGHPSPPHVAMP